MEPREFKSLKLNDTNVISYLKSVLGNPKDNDGTVVSCTFLPSNQKVDKIPISISKLSVITTQYLFGQLKAAHDHKKTLTFADMAVDYKNRRWTRNPQAVFALCYLGVASGVIPEFKEKNGIILIDFDEAKKETGLNYSLFPSYEPTDPKFDPKHPLVGEFGEFEKID